MAVFIFCIVLLAGGIIAAVVGGVIKNTAAIAGGVVVAVVAVAIFIFSGINSVPTKSVGVKTAFGHVEGVWGPGIHWAMPWVDVTDIDETIQTTTFEGKNGLPVRIGGQQTAFLDVTIQWRVLDSGAPGLFYDYNGKSSTINGQGSTDLMGTITDAVVVRELQQVENQTLGDYNPIQDVALAANAGNSQFTTFGPKVLAAMRADLRGRIDVLTLFMPLLHYDSATQTRLNQIQAQYAETAIAKQAAQTNTEQSLANAAISKSLSGPALVYYCLQVTQNALKAGTPLPAGWNCFGGSSSSLALSTGK